MQLIHQNLVIVGTADDGITVPAIQRNVFNHAALQLESLAMPQFVRTFYRSSSDHRKLVGGGKRIDRSNRCRHAAFGAARKVCFEHIIYFDRIVDRPVLGGEALSSLLRNTHVLAQLLIQLLDLFSFKRVGRQRLIATAARADDGT